MRLLLQSHYDTPQKKSWAILCGKTQGFFTLTESGIKALDTVSKHNAHKNVNTRRCRTIACLFYFHILIQGMFIST